VNVAAQTDDPDSVLAHHRRLIELRHQEPVVVHGSFATVPLDVDRVHAFVRRLDGRELLVVANLSSDDALEAAVPDAAAWAGSELALSNAGQPGEQDRIVLGPWEARVYRRG
jgi:oligo-1,6-glucosidase